MTEPAITGTVIAGTLLPDDLLPAFIDALEQLAPDAPRTLQLRAEVNRLDVAGDFGTEDGDGALDDLADAITDALPEGWRFGSHEGDGSDFGVWEVDEDD